VILPIIAYNLACGNVSKEIIVGRRTPKTVKITSPTFDWNIDVK
jgi:hypothetical protein